MPKRYLLGQCERASGLSSTTSTNTVRLLCMPGNRPELGVGAESFRNWTKQAQAMLSMCPERAPRSKELERENRELKEADEIQAVGIDFLREGAVRHEALC
ncbi:transposase [Rhodococcus globerulus]|uniref:transposase n=1 Tax=Rhodococcus globerulus TaxID=33008 RepID=UPI00301A4F53